MRLEAPTLRTAASRGRRLLVPFVVVLVAACAGTGSEGPSPVMDGQAGMSADAMVDPAPMAEAGAPSPDPRVGLEPGLFDAGVAIWNLELLSATPPADDFVGVTNSDLAFKGPYAIQGNYNGFMIWDISDPASPELVTDYLCPASQSDVSVYEDLLFVSGEGLGGRLDCGTGGVPDRVSEERLRGIRIFDISDIRNPEYIANVQTCRGSHTHSVLADPSVRSGERLHLRVRLGGRAAGGGAAGLLGHGPGRGPELGAVPDRGDPGPAGQPGGGGHRQLAADLRRARRPAAARAQRRRPG